MLTLFGSIFAINTHGQLFEFGIQMGVGNYKMADLNEINSYYPSNSEDNKENAFPISVYFQPEIILVYDWISIGLIYTLQKTEGSIYRINSKVNANVVAVKIRGIIREYGNLGIRAYGEIGREYSNLLLSNSNMGVAFKAKSTYVEPGLDFSYKFGTTSLSMNLGYSQQAASSPFYDPDNIYTVTASGDNKPNWTGLRIGISINFMLSKKKI